MANTQIIQPRKFCARRWELTVYWAREVERNPRRSRNYAEPEDDEQYQDAYEHFEARNMVLPVSRVGWNKMRWQFKRVERRTKRVHVDKFHRDMMARLQRRLLTLDVARPDDLVG